jgi:hypothetical protein
MKMCLAPCFKGCTDERYGDEAAAVQDFLATRGESRLVQLRAEREEASAKLEFETAAAIHAQVQRVEAVRSLAPELVRPMSRLRALILQASANADEVAVFLFHEGRLRGPAGFSTIGMRIQNEQSGSSSLFAQPMALEPVPETGDRDQGSGIRDQGPEASSNAVASADGHPSSATTKAARTMLEARMEAVLEELEKDSEPPSVTERQGHLALLKRWYYRPEVKRPGEIFFPETEGNWPVRALLRGVGRVAAQMLAKPDRG